MSGVTYSLLSIGPENCAFSAATSRFERYSGHGSIEKICFFPPPEPSNGFVLHVMPTKSVQHLRRAVLAQRLGWWEIRQTLCLPWLGHSCDFHTERCWDQIQKM
jgi:hypothetical protein